MRAGWVREEGFGEGVDGLEIQDVGAEVVVRRYRGRGGVICYEDDGDAWWGRLRRARLR
jgi:hypothetical protein